MHNPLLVWLSLAQCGHSPELAAHPQAVVIPAWMTKWVLATTIVIYLHSCVNQVVPLAPGHAAEMNTHHMPSSAAFLMLSHFAVTDVLVYAE